MYPSNKTDGEGLVEAETADPVSVRNQKKTTDTGSGQSIDGGGIRNIRSALKHAKPYWWVHHATRKMGIAE